MRGAIPISLLPKFYALSLGSLAVSLGVNLFLVPYRLLDGGMIGIGLLMKYFFDIKPGASIIMISVPIFIYVYFYNRTLFFHSLFGFLFSSVCIDLLSPLDSIITLPILLHCMYGGSLIGLGIGIMLSYGMNTGGTDMIAQIISMRSKLPVAFYIFIIDFAVLLIGTRVIGVERTLYSLITISFVAYFTYYFSNTRVFGRNI